MKKGKIIKEHKEKRGVEEYINLIYEECLINEINKSFAVSFSFKTA